MKNRLVYYSQLVLHRLGKRASGNQGGKKSSMKKRKLKYRFHNPNSEKDTAEFLCKILIDANQDKVERAMREAAIHSEEVQLEMLGEIKADTVVVA